MKSWHCHLLKPHRYFGAAAAVVWVLGAYLALFGFSWARTTWNYCLCAVGNAEALQTPHPPWRPINSPLSAKLATCGACCCRLLAKKQLSSASCFVFIFFSRASKRLRTSHTYIYLYAYTYIEPPDPESRSGKPSFLSTRERTYKIAMAGHKAIQSSNGVQTKLSWKSSVGHSVETPT